MGMMRRIGAACALAGMLAATPAAAGCWTPAEREAAQVRELQTMLMVASLRCRAAGIDILDAYNGFIRASRDAIEAANLRIKTHFAAGGGSQADYDRFTTLLANAYGDAQTDAATCAEAPPTSHAAATSSAELRHLAVNRLFPRVLPGDGCAPSRDTPAAAAPVTIAAAPPPAVVRLPDEVTAALAVMARYGASPMPPAAAPTRLAAVAR